MFWNTGIPSGGIISGVYCYHLPLGIDTHNRTGIDNFYPLPGPSERNTVIMLINGQVDMVVHCNFQFPVIFKFISLCWQWIKVVFLRGKKAFFTAIGLLLHPCLIMPYNLSQYCNIK